MYSDIPDDLRNLIEPVVEDHGYELMNVESVHGRQSVLLRITIDSRSGDGRVPVDDIASVSREIETHFDATDAVQDAYRLEVSSPGLDRMLARETDFERARGREVKIKTRRPLDGRRRFKGELVDFRDGVVLLKVDGAGDGADQETRVAFDDIEKANVVYAFSSEDFVGGAAGAKNGAADTNGGAADAEGRSAGTRREARGVHPDAASGRRKKAARSRDDRTDD